MPITSSGSPFPTSDDARRSSETSLKSSLGHSGDNSGSMGLQGRSGVSMGASGTAGSSSSNSGLSGASGASGTSATTGSGSVSGHESGSGSESVSGAGAQGGGQQALDRVVRTAHDTVDRLAQSVAPHIQRLTQGASNTNEALHARADQARDMGDEWTESLRSTVRENPVAAVVAALAVGVLLARMTS